MPICLSSIKRSDYQACIFRCPTGGPIYHSIQTSCFTLAPYVYECITRPRTFILCILFHMYMPPTITQSLNHACLAFFIPMTDQRMFTPAGVLEFLAICGNACEVQ